MSCTRNLILYQVIYCKTLTLFAFPTDLIPLASGQMLAIPAVDPRAVRARQDAEVTVYVLGILLDLPKLLVGCALELRLARHAGLLFITKLRLVYRPGQHVYIIHFYKTL